MGARFPDGFLFGAAQSAHQIEGGNVNSDWWWWEHQPGSPCREPSGDACDSYHRYREDIQLLAGFGLDAYRFSIEWARIEPAEGQFSRAALDHYRRQLACCHEHRVTPVVTFHHFTVPRWVMDLGGFASDRFPALFERYCDRATATLGDLIGWACTINEPEGWGEGGWLLGINPPGRKGDTEGMWRVAENALEAHRLAVPAIRSHTRAPVGVCLALPDLQYEDGARPGQTSVELNSQVSDRFFALAQEQKDDFVGVQTYTRNRFGPEGPRGPHVDYGRGLPEERADTTQLGQELYPPALGNSVRRAWRATGGLPVLVTESGIGTAHDEKRIAHTAGALQSLLDCLGEGIDLRGFLYWSLLDNFEWSLGYAATFGLVAVDRQTFARRPKPSAYWLGAVARSRTLPA